MSNKLTEDQIEALGLDGKEIWNGSGFIHDAPCYKFKDSETYISRYDWRVDELLKDLWLVVGYFYIEHNGVKNKGCFSFRVSQEPFKDVEYFKKFISNQRERQMAKAENDLANQQSIEDYFNN